MDIQRRRNDLLQCRVVSNEDGRTPALGRNRPGNDSNSEYRKELVAVRSIQISRAIPHRQSRHRPTSFAQILEQE